MTTITITDPFAITGSNNIIVKQSIQMNGKEFTISFEPGAIKEPNFQTKTLIEKLAKDLSLNFPQSGTLDALRGRINSLNKTLTELNTKKNYERDYKFFSFLKTALLTYICASFVQICHFTTKIVFLVQAPILVKFLALGAAVCFSFVFFKAIQSANLDSTKNMVKIENRVDSYKKPWYFIEENDQFKFTQVPHIIAGGLILPLYEAFTRISRLNRVFKQQQEDLKNFASKGDLNEEFISTYQFYKINSTILYTKLDLAIKNIDESIKVMETLPERSKLGEKDILVRLNRHKEAQQELAEIAEFYEKFA